VTTKSTDAGIGTCTGEMCSSWWSCPLMYSATPADSISGSSRSTSSGVLPFSPPLYTGKCPTTMIQSALQPASVLVTQAHCASSMAGCGEEGGAESTCPASPPVRDDVSSMTNCTVCVLNGMMLVKV
jgi:hypothetical protein